MEIQKNKKVVADHRWALQQRDDFACLFLRWEEPISSLLAVASYHKQIPQFGSWLYAEV